MIYLGRFPAIRHVAGSALHAKCARVCVIFSVTRGAVHGRALEYAALMTTFAGNCSVFAIEVEGEGCVVHFGQIPAIRCVAGSTIRSILTVVFIILGMAGETILRGGLQVRKFTRVDMALGTCSQGVPANQIERRLIMVEGLAM